MKNFLMRKYNISNNTAGTLTAVFSLIEDGTLNYSAASFVLFGVETYLVGNNDREADVVAGFKEIFIELSKEENDG